MRPVVAWLGERAEAADAASVDSTSTRDAFRVAVGQPRSGVLRLVVAWLLAPPVICIGMWIGTSGSVGFDRRIRRARVMDAECGALVVVNGPVRGENGKPTGAARPGDPRRVSG